jgi:hypothetical protein
MENQTAFDLNHSIQQWRENLGQSPAFRSENLNELESHLRDSIATLQAKGLSAEEAFIIAARRMGNHNALEKEYGKVNGDAVWLDRIVWILVGVQVWSLVSMLFASVCQMAFAFGWNALSHDYKASGTALPVAAFSIIQLVAMGTAVWFCWWLIMRKGPRFANSLRMLLGGRFAMSCAAFSLLVLLAYGMGFVCPILKFKFLSMALLSEVAKSQSIARIITTPIQIVTLVIATLALARKRFRISPA